MLFLLPSTSDPLGFGLNGHPTKGFSGGLQQVPTKALQCSSGEILVE